MVGEESHNFFSNGSRLIFFPFSNHAVSLRVPRLAAAFLSLLADEVNLLDLLRRKLPIHYFSRYSTSQIIERDNLLRYRKMSIQKKELFI